MLSTQFSILNTENKPLSKRSFLGYDGWALIPRKIGSRCSAVSGSSHVNDLLLYNERAETDRELRLMVSKAEAETIRSFTRGDHHCAWKADPYTKTPACPHKALTNQLFADACADSANIADWPMSTARFLVLDAAHAATTVALEARGSNRHNVFVPNLYPATVHSLRATGVTAWMGDVRSFLLHRPPPPPFLGIYLDACGSVKRYTPTILRILGISDVDAGKPLTETYQPLIGVGHGGQGVFAITLDHRDPQEPGSDAMDTFFAVINDAAERSCLRINCLTSDPPTGCIVGCCDGLRHGRWVRERGGEGPGGAYSYNGMFFALFRVARRNVQTIMKS